MQTHEPIAVNEWIELTAFEHEDADNLIRYINDPEVYRNTLTIPYPYTAAHAADWMGFVARNQTEYGMPINWAIRHRDAGLVGIISTFMKKGIDGHSDEIGYWIAAPMRGRGYMTEVVIRFSDWVFIQRPKLVRLEAFVFSYNPASVRVLEKAGYQQEGYLRKWQMKDGQAIDAIALSKIRQTS